MTRKLLIISALSLFIFALLASAIFADVKRDNDFFKKQANRVKLFRNRLSGADKPTGYIPPTDGNQSLGFEQIISLSPGLQIGTTTYDIQSNSRQTRQVNWRATQMIHLIWMRADDLEYTDRGTGYNFWDPDEAELGFADVGCDVHARSPDNYSGYVCVDVDTEGKVVIANHHNVGTGYASTVWYDFGAGSCFFSPYRSRVPDSVQEYGLPPGEIATGNNEVIWPYMEYHIFDGDTITHVFSQHSPGDATASAVTTYFRRVGSDTLGYWEYPPMLVDTQQCIAQIVTASRISGKVALVWQAPPGQYPGDPESLTRDGLDPGLGVTQRTNDVYYMISTDMGDTWGPKINMSAYDSTQGGWLGHGDISALIDSNDKLHALWPAREILPTSASEDGGLGEYAHFWGSRLLHWDEVHNEVRPVKDANWDLPDSGCVGGGWAEMSIVKVSLSECDNKFYAFFVQFNDIYNGIDNDCAHGRYTGEYSWQGTANGEIYVSVSNDGGYSWDIARNLTNTYTPHCFQDESEGLPVCESDMWPSSSRFGMQNTTGDFTGVVVVDPSEGYTGDKYLDVVYINDKFPGDLRSDDEVATINPVKWFRVPCVEPVPNPVLIYTPQEIDQPTWTKPGIEIDTFVMLENIGNADLHISTIAVIEFDHFGWLDVENHGPLTIEKGAPPTDLTIYLNRNGTVTDGPHVLNGYVVINSDAVGGSVDSVEVTLIVADTVQFPEESEVRTSCKRIMFNNAGNMGNSGEGGYNLDFVGFGIDCDVTDNDPGQDDRADVYLYDASPFITRLDGADTILNTYIWSGDWLDDNGFRPLVSPFADSTSYDDYQYGNSGGFVTQDSLIGITVEYFAPTDIDTCEFIVVRQTFYNNSDATISGVIIGDVMDWDIPADSGSRNQSGYDDSEDMQFMYCYGYDYGPTDSFPNNDCVDDDLRVGGYAYYAGYRIPYCEVTDSLPVVQAQYTHMNADWVYPNGGLVAEEFYPHVKNVSGYSTWEATGDPTNSDSMAQDLHHVVVFGEYDIGVGDSLVFVKILATEYDGGVSALTQTIQLARGWIAGHPEVFAWPVAGECDCCDFPGDANNNNLVNILDITYLIANLYKGGPPPPCLNEGDANGNCLINILDITYLIANLYKGGPDPVCGCVE